ncbi:MEDS domain-containing protein [Actinomadura rubrisoli]|nr:MEDS domain-containing protein [Actinomadura rubrisoli]
MAHSKAVGEMLSGDHVCLAYDSAEERRAILMAFVRDGLLSGQAVVYLVEDETAGSAADRLRAAFGAPRTGASGRRASGPGAGLDAGLRAALDDALDDGRMTVLTRGEIGSGPAGVEDAIGGAVESALRRGRAGVRVTAEASPSLRGWPGTDRFAAFEDAIRRAVAGPGSAAMALCQYDRRWFVGDHLRAVEDCHGVRVRADDLFDDGVLRITPLFAPPGLRLSGAIDESTLPALVAALRDVDDRAPHLCLDLSRLDFCDLDGLRTLIEANRTSTVLDRQVILRSMPGCMELMLRVSGWETAPGIVTEGVR